VPDLYVFLLFFHIVAAILWLGAGVLLDLLAVKAERVEDASTMKKLIDDADGLSNTFFIPAALATVIFGVLLVIDGPWSFGDLWILIGLAGFAFSFVVGAFHFGPETKRINEAIERDGGLSAKSFADTRRMLAIGRFETVVLFVVVFDMVTKPSSETTGTLVLMGAAVVLGALYFAWRARSIPAEQPGIASPRSAG
jgi:uncharacterized membrane protein